MMFAISVIALATDAPTLAIVLGFVASVLTTIGGGFVALNLNRNEKKQSAETALEKTLRERIVLRDEELIDVRQDLQMCRAEKDAAIKRAEKAEQQRDRLYLAIAEQRAEERMHNGDS